MVSQRSSLFLALAALTTAPLAGAFCPAQAPATSTRLAYQNNRGNGADDWDYDYGGSLKFGTGQYRQRYSNDRHTSGGVNSSYNGYSMQANNEGRYHPRDREERYERDPRMMRGSRGGRDHRMMMDDRGGEFYPEDDEMMDMMGGGRYEDDRRMMGGEGRMMMGRDEDRRMMGGEDRMMGGRRGGGMSSFSERRARHGGRGGMDRGGYGGDDFGEGF